MKDNKIDNISPESDVNKLKESNNISIAGGSLPKDNTENIQIEIELKPEEITLKEEKVEDIFSKIEKDPKMEVYNSYSIARSKNIISLENDNNNFETHYLFKKELIINYKNASVSNKIVNLVDKSVKSSIQIEKAMKTYKIKSLIYEADKHRNFPTFKYILYDLVENNNYTIDFLCLMDSFKYIYDKKRIQNIPYTIKLNSLSTYSDKYFKYSDNEIDRRKKKFFQKIKRFHLYGRHEFF